VTIFAKRDLVAGLEKGLQVIEAFDQERSRLTIAEVAERTGLTRAAARRYLITLTHLGYMRHENKLFSLTPMVLRLGQSYLHSARLPRIVQPLAVPAGLYAGGGGVGRRARSRPAGVRGGGQRRAAGVGHAAAGHPRAGLVHRQRPHAAGGAAAGSDRGIPGTRAAGADHRAHHRHKERLALEIARVRAQGYALVDQELELGLRTMAVPLKNFRGDVVAAMNISVHAGACRSIRWWSAACRR
jgi:IclR family pca regulon transcriptional regulator